MMMIKIRINEIYTNQIRKERKSGIVWRRKKKKKKDKEVKKRKNKYVKEQKDDNDGTKPN